MAEEAAILEPLEATDVDLETGNEGESTGETIETEPGTEETSTEGEDLSAPQLWKDVKERLKDNPVLSRQVKKAIHFLEDANKRMPDGIGKTLERLEAVRRLADDPEVADAEPIETLIENTLSERSFWRDFDTKFQAGDGAVISQMIEANPESFQKIFPAAFTELSRINPDGFSSLVSNVAVNYLDQQNLPVQFAILDTFLPQKSDDPATQRVIDAISSIRGALDNLRSFSKKPYAAVGGEGTVKPGNVQEAGGDLEQRELRIRDAEFNRDIASSSNQFMAQEAAKVSKGAKFSESELQSIRSKVREEINARVSIDRKYQTAISSYLKANNKSAYTQRVQSEHRKIIPGAVRRAVDDVLAKRGTNGAVKKPVAPPVAKTSLPAEEGVIRYERIAGPPATQGLKVDLDRTPQSMLVKGQAYIKGRKNPVTWSRK